MLKTKVEKLQQNQNNNENIPKGVNASFELQLKKHSKRKFNKVFQLMNHILDAGKEHCKEATIRASHIVADIT